VNFGQFPKARAPNALAAATGRRTVFGLMVRSWAMDARYLAGAGSRTQGVHLHHCTASSDWRSRNDEHIDHMGLPVLRLYQLLGPEPFCDVLPVREVRLHGGDGMTDRPELTDDMRAAIEIMAKRFNCTQQSVLKRMVFSYAAKFEGPASTPDTTNVVSLWRPDE